MTTVKKITTATFKSFVRKHRASLLIKVRSSFDGMVDGCVPESDTFRPAAQSDIDSRHTLGIRGVWLVGQSRDYFTAYTEDGISGISVSNSCGDFTVAIEA